MKHFRKERVQGRFFPRWNALSKVKSQKLDNLGSNEEGSPSITSAIMIAGDSTLENDIGVAHGFPQLNLERGEIIILQDILDVLGLEEGDTVEI